MRSVAIAVNLLQMFIIVALFFGHGFGLGGLTIIALFILLVASFFNLLVLLFHFVLADTNHAGNRSRKGRLVKRQDLRVRYPFAARPELMVKDRRYPVLDLTVNGVRIGIRRQEPLKRRFRAQMTLLSGQTLHLRVLRVRRQGDEAALLIRRPLGWEVIIVEKELASARKGQSRG